MFKDKNFKRPHEAAYTDTGCIKYRFSTDRNRKNQFSEVPGNFVNLILIVSLFFVSCLNLSKKHALDLSFFNQFDKIFNKNIFTWNN